MDSYKGVEYTVIQTTKPTVWRWTVYFDSTRPETGRTYSKQSATIHALREIDKRLRSRRDFSKQVGARHLAQQ